MDSLNRVPTPWSYSLAVRAGDYLFLGLHRGTGSSFGEQLGSAIEAVGETLAEFDLDLGAIVKIHVWLRQISDLPDMEMRFARSFRKMPIRLG